jgi:hypothetical protein
MENGGGGAKPTTRFTFSWADEVEREEREQAAIQQQLLLPRRQEAKREQIKADPFGAARPREVVLAEKGVDWRARDRELDLGAAPRPPRRATRSRNRRTASTAAASACAATPARGVPPLDRDAGRTPHPMRQAAATASTPRPPPPVTTGRRNAAPVGRARGGSKRKFAGEGPVRRAPPVGDHAEQGRRVFRELNVVVGCGSSLCASAAGNGCNCNPGGSQDDGMKEARTAAANGAPSTAVTAAGLDESAAGKKRSRGGKGKKRRGSGKAKKQQSLVV